MTPVLGSYRISSPFPQANPPKTTSQNREKTMRFILTPLLGAMSEASATLRAARIHTLRRQMGHVNERRPAEGHFQPLPEKGFPALHRKADTVHRDDADSRARTAAPPPLLACSLLVSPLKSELDDKRRPTNVEALDCDAPRWICLSPRAGIGAHGKSCHETNDQCHKLWRERRRRDR